MKHQQQLRRARGFTLIELMIVLAIVAILVAMAVPAYKDYTVRSKVTECVNGGAVAKIQISEYQQSLGDWPASAEEASISLPSGISQYCSGFTDYQPASGAFTILINSTVIDSSLGLIAPTLTPTQVDSGSINWDCSRGSTPAANVKYLPTICRSNT